MKQTIMLIALFITILSVSLICSLITISDENEVEKSIVVNGFDDDRDIPELVNC